MLSLPIPNRRRIPLGIATAVAVALVAAAPSQAAPTAVEQTSATSFNYALPGDAIALNFTRKAG
jgi:hypothetical protein